MSIITFTFPGTASSRIDRWGRRYGGDSVDIRGVTLDHDAAITIEAVIYKRDIDPVHNISAMNDGHGFGASAEGDSDGNSGRFIATLS